MFRRSLTAKILIAVGMTVAVVIAIYTFFVIRMQSTWWHERTQAQNLITATVVHEYLNGVMLSDRHTEVQNFLHELQKSNEILRGRLIRPDGTIAFSTETQEVGRVMQHVPPELFGERRILHGQRTVGGEHLAVVMRPVPNLATCQRCHDKTDPIGAIVLEKSLAPAEASISTNRNLLIAYGIVIFVLVGIVLWLLLVRLVSQPVSELLEQMNRVGKGDLQARADDRRDDEIGELAGGFNAMVANLESTTSELHASHQKQIQQAGKLASIGELASGIAHEIRNPLAGIGATVEVLAENQKGDKQFAEIAGEIRKQVNRLNTTLRDLLDFARQREPEIVPCQICDIVKPMIALVRPDMQKHHIALVENCPANLPPMCGDEPQVQQAVLNVLLNAIQAMPDGGTLTLSAEALDKSLKPGHPQTLRFTVQDTGIGISKENQERIFSPFFTTKHRGTGLGLAITRSILEKHTGNISVESEPGRGTKFILEFPVCKQEVTDAQGQNTCC
jgi:signal transduction histidine kinase